MLKDVIQKHLPEGAKLTTPPKRNMGDIAIELFNTAKERKTSPMAIATELMPEMLKIEGVLSAEIAGPYLNLKLDRKTVLNDVMTAASDDSLYTLNIGKNKPALIEHTSINPNASPHIGRARNAIIGDSISRLLRYVGYDLNVHYYVNDMGKQIAMLVLACADKENVSFNDILDIYVEASARLKVDKNYEREVFEYLKKFEDGDTEVISAFKELVSKCVAGQSNVFKQINIAYDTFDHESKFVHDEELEGMVNNMLEEGIAFIDEDDRVVVDLQKIGFNRDEGRYYVLKRANGSTMYGYRDIAYHIYKARACPDEATSFVVLGEDHKLYFEQLALILKHLGVMAPNPIHYNFITLKEGKMSTRQGNVILLEDFIQQVRETVAERFKAVRNNPAIIEKIATGAVRFNIIKIKPNSPITFDRESALSLEGDTCPYVQYTCVRARKIISDAGDIPADFAVTEIPDAMWALIDKIDAFKDNVDTAYRQMNPARIAQYLIELCQAYNSFYANVRILTNDDENIKHAGVHLCKVTATTIEKGLNILGIDVPEYM